MLLSRSLENKLARAAVNQICVIHDAINGCNNLKIQ